ncbi:MULTISPECIES: hypothetical protein [Bacillota]|uniref:hypothetical protein n=1 Tax=Bacillota TaxID=1239 RepID=UPI0039F0B293
MENADIEIPNFIVLRKDPASPAIYKVTICQRTLTTIHEEELKGMPSDWSAQDFYELLDEGNRFLILPGS